MSSTEVLSYMPPPGGKTPVRLQASLSQEESQELYSLLSDPTLPFDGDTTKLVRTALRLFFSKLQQERLTDGSLHKDWNIMMSSEFAEWHTARLDQFAMSACKHLDICIQRLDFTESVATIEKVRDLHNSVSKSTRALMTQSLAKRGFFSLIDHLRNLFIQEGETAGAYQLDDIVGDFSHDK